METRTRYIYRITNLVNGKTYIGQHTVRVNRTVTSDTYMGSGKMIRAALAKYGKENLKKDILLCGEYTKEEIDKFEKCAIFVERICGKAEYNIADGGQGWNEGLRAAYEAAIHTESYKRNHSAAMKKAVENGHMKGWTKHDTFKGRHHSEDTKKKISETAKKQNRSGSNNGSFGKHWFTNGIENVKCEICPEGFTPGRCVSK